MTTRDPSEPYPAIFTDWVFGKLGAQLANPAMFAAWLKAGMIRETEEGYSPTAKGREIAVRQVKRAQDHVAEQVRAKRGKRIANEQNDKCGS